MKGLQIQVLLYLVKWCSCFQVLFVFWFITVIKSLYFVGGMNLGGYRVLRAFYVLLHSQHHWWSRGSGKRMSFYLAGCYFTHINVRVKIILLFSCSIVQSHYVFTQRVIDTLNLEKFESMDDVNGLNSWLEVTPHPPPMHVYVLWKHYCHCITHLQEDLIPGIYSDNFEGSNTTNITTGATGWLLQGPVRVAQIRSNLFKCAEDLHPNLRKYPYQCTVHITDTLWPSSFSSNRFFLDILHRRLFSHAT